MKEHRKRPQSGKGGAKKQRRGRPSRATAAHSSYSESGTPSSSRNHATASLSLGAR